MPRSPERRAGVHREVDKAVDREVEEEEVGGCFMVCRPQFT
jgi:hypothetical protein